MTIRRRRVAQLAAAALALGLVAAACGDDDSGGSADTTAGADTTAAAATTATAATTTAAAGETTTTAGATTTAAGADMYTFDTANCPASSTTPLPDGQPIKVLFSGPQTGPLAGFGLIGQGLKIVFDKTNEAGGVAGHPIELVQKDDAYDPARTKTNVQEALEKDNIQVSLLQVGTPNVAAVRQLFEETCVPQAYVGTGFPAWGDPENFKYTVGGILAYNTEAEIWADYIADVQPGAKVAVLVYNNDFGKAYQAAFSKAAEEKGLDVVEEVLHEPTSTLNNEVTTILASGPDVIVGATTATFCGELAKQARQGGFEGPMVVSSTCFSSQFLAPAEKAAANIFGVGYLKDPTDPQWADDANVKAYLADSAKYAPDAKPEISSVVTGYTFGSLLVDTFALAEKQFGDISPVNIAQAMWNINTVLPLAYPGAKYIINGNNDAYGIEFGEVREYLPDTGTFKSTGKTYDREGQTGLWGS